MNYVCLYFCSFPKTLIETLNTTFLENPKFVIHILIQQRQYKGIAESMA